MSAPRRLHDEQGYSLVELLIASAIMLVVTGAIFGMMNPSQGTAQVQPEVADMQQRLRLGADTLFKELVMAGAGVYQGPVTGSLINFFAPVIPRRIGMTDPDPAMGINSARSDTITLAYIPNTYSQTTISSPMPNVSAELKVSDQNNCPDGQNLCGFKEGMEVIIFDTSGHWDIFTITEVQDAAAHLQHRGQDLSVPYEIVASVTQIESNTYYWCRPDSSRVCPDATASQLRRYDGGTQDIPLVENVVDLVFEYFGDPEPPLKPKPPLGTANCLYDATGTYIGPAALPADDGSLAKLPLEILRDGPYCGGGSSLFDVDLLRIRKVRVSLRVQVGSPALRGNDTVFWRNPGGAQGSARAVRDLAVSVDVSPRNLNLAR